MNFVFALSFLALVGLTATTQVGQASWYSEPGALTASGEVMQPMELTAAHKTLPFNTRVLVENLRNGEDVIVRINDRGPFIDGRIIDLSLGAASEIGLVKKGTTKVRITVLK